MATLAGSGGLFDFSSLFGNLSGTTTTTNLDGVSITTGTGSGGTIISLVGTGSVPGAFSSSDLSASLSGGMGGLFSTSTDTLIGGTGSTLFGGTGGTLRFQQFVWFRWHDV